MMGTNQIERMRAILAQALAEAGQRDAARVRDVHLVIYGAIRDADLFDLFEQASQGTQAEGARLHIDHAGSRYICWNCCGLRFESEDGVCPNCGDLALEVPEEIEFALKRVEVE